MKKLCMLATAFIVGTAHAAFAQLITSTTTVSERTIAQEEKKETRLDRPRYQGELNIGYATGGKLNLGNGGDFEGKVKTDFSRPMIETVHGVRINQYAFAGVGLGAHYAYGNMLDSEYEASIDGEAGKWNTLLIPLFLNLKGYYPVTDTFAPYVSLSFGTSFCACSDLDQSESDYESKLKGGYYGEYGLGFNYKKLNFGFGLVHQGMKVTETEYDGGPSDNVKMKINSFYLKIGLKF